VLKKIHGLELEDPRPVPFNVDTAYAASGGTPHGKYVKISIFFVNNCQLITLKFIAGLLWATGLWTMGVMSDGILPPLPRPLGLLTQPVIVQRRKDTNIRRI
jgi:hypothetical protein